MNKSDNEELQPLYPGDVCYEMVNSDSSDVFVTFKSNNTIVFTDGGESRITIHLDTGEVELDAIFKENPDAAAQTFWESVRDLASVYSFNSPNSDSGGV